MYNKFNATILGINKWIIRLLMIILTLCLILASIYLCYVIYNRITQPPFLLIELSTLFEIFNLLLVIAVGYELMKSFYMIVTSEDIPVVPIIEIAIIALANKVITLDFKVASANTLFGMAALMIALGAAHFLTRFKSETNQSHSEK